MTDKIKKPDPKKRGLGRGLDAIFGEDDNVDSSLNVSRETNNDDVNDLNTNQIISDDLKRRVMPVEWLHPCEFQPRKIFNEDALNDLARSISMHGILQPIVVRPSPESENKYEIIAGERRWRAAQLSQLHEVPVVIQYLDDETVLEIALIENLQREDLTAIEEADALQQLMVSHGHTQEKLSEKIGKSRSYIANSLRLLSLPKPVLQLVNDGKISAGHARAIVGKDNAEAIASRIIDEGLSVRAVEKLVQNDNKTDLAKPSSSTSVKKDVNTVALEDEISRILGLNVTIQAAKKSGKGKIKIQYNNFDQLDDVIHRLSKH